MAEQFCQTKYSVSHYLGHMINGKYGQGTIQNRLKNATNDISIHEFYNFTRHYVKYTDVYPSDLTNLEFLNFKFHYPMALLYQPSSRSELVLAQHLFSLLSTQLHSTLDDYIVFLVLKLSSKAPRKPSYRSVGAKRGEGALCVHIDFTRTFQTNDKYNNVNYV